MATGEFRLSFTAQEIDNRLKKLDDIQSDYEQNNSSADNYIKNRPFYTGDPVETELVDINAVLAEYGAAWEQGEETVDGTNYTWQVYLPMVGLVEGETYSVLINGTKYSGAVQNLRETEGAPFDIFTLGDYDAISENNYEAFTYCIQEAPSYDMMIVVYKGLEAPTECKIFSFKQEVKKLDPKYLPESGFGYEESVPEKVILEEQTVEGFTEMDLGIYGVENPFDIALVSGDVYVVTWDGTEYKLKCEAYNDECVYIGNPNYVEMVSGGDIPFTVLSWGGIYIATESTEASHTISITKAATTKIHQIDKKYAAQADWNVSDPESNAYIQNRPFGIDKRQVTIVNNLTYEDYDNGNYPPVDDFIIGKYYTVIFNGTTYENVLCDGYDGDYQWLGGEFAGYPFYIETYGNSEGRIYFSSDEYFETLTIIGPKEVIVSMDPKFLPEGGVGYTEEESVIFPSTTLTNFEEYDSKYFIELYPEFELIEGREYRVIWDGVEYFYTCGNDYGDRYLGSFDSDPFIIWDGRYVETVNEDSEHTLEVSIMPLVHKIDEKYLPIFQDEKTLYLDTLFEEQTFEMGDDYVKISNALTFEEGKTYVVTFNGEQYSCIAWYHELSGGIAIGNGSFINMDGMGDDVPFTCLWYDGECGLYTSKSGTYTIKIEGETLVNKIDPKYLPDSIGGATLTEAVDSITFKDAKTGWEYIGYIYDGNWITCRKFESIEITQMPNKTEYYEDDVFDPTGMVITGIYSDGDTKEIKNYNYQDSISEEFKIFCVDGGVYITLNLYIIPPAPEDFEYIEDTEAGTYTLTGWKGTYNGESSSEMIIPDRDNIIL